MAHDVFISHSSKDKTTGDAVCATLEANGIRCWIAPRDVLPGSDWGESIIGAIKGARVMVLVFSSNANQSLQIKREVERAVSHGLIIIPLRIEDVAPSPALEYFMSTPHWLEAFTPPLERHLQNLTQVIKDILSKVPEETKSGGPMPATKVVAQENLGPEQAEGIDRRKVITLSLLVGAALGLASWWFMPIALKTTNHDAAVATNSVPTTHASLVVPPSRTVERSTTQPLELGPMNVLALSLDDGTKMEMKLMPTGTLLMGSPASDNMKKPSDTPQHEVLLTKPFYIGVTEVTRQQFQTFLSQTGYQTDAEKSGAAVYCDRGKFKPIAGRNWRNPGYESGPDHPVTCVTWDDANQFCKWLSTKTGRRIRLPTEAEWEYACRAGTKTRYQWSDDPMGGEGWCNVSDQTLKGVLHLHVPGINSNGACDWRDGFAFTSPVGSFHSNAWGLFDMLGNVWEWCADWYQRDYYQETGRVDPQGPDSGSQRVIRGGCFDESPREFRSTSRSGMNPEWADFGVGFRVCFESEGSTNDSATLAPPIVTGPVDAAISDQAIRMTWWREAKFGMFITWGLYSVLGGYYHGKPGGRWGEWIMNSAEIPVEEYAAFARQFNPVKFNADEWVRIAKDAGMKYIVITAKHNEGFAMFHSKASPFNIFDASPFKRDPLAELAEACRKQGIKLGFYYSHNVDWHHPGGGIFRNRNGGLERWDPAQKGNSDNYVDDLVIPQVKEILTQYGEIPIIWFDTQAGFTQDQADRVYKTVMECNPNIIMNNRLGGGYKGDTETHEQTVPDQALPDRDWETCMTINDTWGYKRDDANYKSTRELLGKLIDISSKGGNFLLNVGPDPEGVIPAGEVESITGIGKWLQVNGEAIYGTTASPCDPPVWGRYTMKTKVVYAHVLDWPQDGLLPVAIKGLKSPVAYLLANKAKLEVKETEDGLSITLPAEAPDPIASVIVIEHQ